MENESSAKIDQDRFDIREYSFKDRPFIFKTWKNALYFGNSWFREIPDQIFDAKYHKIIDFILHKPNVVVKVCCLKEASDVILGYAVLEKAKDNILHFTFVKDSWRGLGIARELCFIGNDSIKICTHLTKIGKTIKYKKNLVFNPFLQGE